MRATPRLFKRTAVVRSVGACAGRLGVCRQEGIKTKTKMAKTTPLLGKGGVGVVRSISSKSVRKLTEPPLAPPLPRRGVGFSPNSTPAAFPHLYHFSGAHIRHPVHLTAWPADFDAVGLSAAA